MEGKTSLSITPTGINEYPTLNFAAPFEVQQRRNVQSSYIGYLSLRPRRLQLGSAGPEEEHKTSATERG